MINPRIDRAPDALRTVKITPNYLKHPEGSVLIEMGETKVICNATFENRIPPFLKGQGTGWLTAEYGMLPRSTGVRMKREAAFGKQTGRTQEIQRLIGRSLRQAVNLKLLGENQIIIDCEVIQADGGTRTAGITGAYVALSLALTKLVQEGTLKVNPLITQIAAVSVGMVGGEARLDLDYEEDSNCDSDINVVMNERREIIEIQGTAEGKGFNWEELSRLVGYAESGIKVLFAAQKKALEEAQLSPKEV